MMEIDIGVIQFIKSYLPEGNIVNQKTVKNVQKAQKFLDEIGALAIQSGGIVHLDLDAECICKLKI